MFPPIAILFVIGNMEALVNLSDHAWNSMVAGAAWVGMYYNAGMDLASIKSGLHRRAESVVFGKHWLRYVNIMPNVALGKMLGRSFRKILLVWMPQVNALSDCFSRRISTKGRNQRSGIPFLWWF